MVKALMVSAMLALAGCTTSGGSFCAISKPIRLSETTIAAMTDAEVNAALVHNEQGRALCGWQP